MIPLDETSTVEAVAPKLTRRSLLAAAPATLLAATACSKSSSAGSAGQGEVSLNYGLWDDTQLPAMKKIISAFEKDNPHITVRTQLTPWESYWTKLQTAATAGTAPDVFWMTQDSFKLYASGGVLMGLDDLVARDKVDMGNFVESVTHGYTWQGKLYGIPKDINSFGVFYNKKLFAAANIRPPDLSWTWNDLVHVAKRLTDPAAGVFGFAAQLADVEGYYLTIPQSGGYVISADGTKSGYDDPRTISGLQFWTDMILKHHASPTLQQLTDTAAQSMFTSGKVAMYYGGSWEPVAMKAVPYARENTDIAPLPKDQNRKFYANGLGNVIFAKTDHPKEAWEFAKFLGSQQAAEIQAATGTVIPATKGNDEAYSKSMPEFSLSKLIDQLPLGLPFPASVNTAVWENDALKQFADAWSGKKGVQTVAKSVAASMNAALAKEPH
jgi:multiple sugar transport system substrate-binding protein